MGVSVLVLGLLPTVQAQEFARLIFTNAAGGTLPYRLLSPTGYDAAKKYPLVIFFHGAGERGTDNSAQLKHGTGLFLQQQAQFPCFVLAPQCPNNQQWVDMPWGTDSGTRPPQPSAAMQLESQPSPSIDFLLSLAKS